MESADDELRFVSYMKYLGEFRAMQFSLEALKGSPENSLSMPRFARITLPNQPYLVCHATSNSAGLFPLEGDHEVYLNMLHEACEACGLSLLAYALLPDRVYHLVSAGDIDCMAQAIGRAHMRYSLHVKRTTQRNGPALWTGRFSSTMLEGSLVPDGAKFVERAAMRAGLESAPGEYRWGSAHARVKGDKDPFVESLGMKPGVWRKWILEPLDAALLQEFSKNLKTGRPTGSTAWLQKMEKQIGRSLVARPRGRRPGGAKAQK